MLLEEGWFGFGLAVAYVLPAEEGGNAHSWHRAAST